MIADCPSCKAKITIFPEDGWSYCPSCNMLVRLDTSISSSPKVEAGKRDRDRIVTNSRISRTYVPSSSTSTRPTTPEPPRVIPVASAAPAQPRPTTTARPTVAPPVSARTGSASGQPTAANPAAPVSPRSPAMMTQTEVSAERSQIAREITRIDRRRRALIVEMEQSGDDPEQTRALGLEMAQDDTRRSALQQRETALQAREAALQAQAARASQSTPVTRTVTPTRNSPGGDAQKAFFGFLVAFFVIAIGIFGWQVGLNWDLKALGLTALIALVGGALSWFAAYITYS